MDLDTAKAQVVQRFKWRCYMTRTRLTVMACVVAGAISTPLPALAECLNQQIGQIYLPMNLTNAPSAAHVMASVMTSKGLLEARASQEQSGTSEITFFLDGKALKPVKTSELRRETIKCSDKRTALSASERLYAALSVLCNSIITEAEASRYSSKFGCTGRGTVEVVLVDSEERSNGSTIYFFQFKQGGHVCGWASYEA
jgi:hypothetical protein